jgi:hypothetical protein
VFRLFDKKKRKEARARNKELGGDLDAAIELYVEAELNDDAARVLLLKADGVRDLDKRMVLCAQAARVGDGSEHGREAQKRKALLGYDLVKGAGGTTMHGELSRAAAELEAVGAWEQAAEAFALAGDVESEIRVLKDAGAIERLEERLRQTSLDARRERDLAQLLRRMKDLDLIAERREAIKSARMWLDGARAFSPEQGYARDALEGSEQVELELDRISTRLINGPVITLVVHGATLTYVLGSSITIGRSNADIDVVSSGVSRQHLRLFRDHGVPKVEDMKTRNGTLLAGAKISGALPIAGPLELSLASDVPCRLSPAVAGDPGGPIAVEVAGETHLVPLGPLHIGDWQLVDAHDGADRFIVLRTPEGREPPYMAGYRLAYQIELCAGDELRAERDGPVVLAVPAPPADRSSRRSGAGAHDAFGR